MAIQKNAEITKEHFEDAKSVAYAVLDKLPVSLRYHIKEHTILVVVPAALTIADKEKFSLEAKMLVGIAAAFHDTGFTKQYENNEPVSAQIAENYMKTSRYEYTTEQIKIVVDAIINTNMKNPPQTKYAAVLRDADASLLGSENYLTSRRTLKLELMQHHEARLHKCAIDDDKWNKHSLEFMEQHRWFTESAKRLYESKKQKNIKKYKEKYNLN